MATVQRLKGFIFLAFLYYTGLFGTIVIMGPTLILLCLRPRWFRWVNDHLTVWWLVLPPVSTYHSNIVHNIFFPNFWVLMLLVSLYLLLLSHDDIATDFLKLHAIKRDNFRLVVET